jgi:hypothetical protein
LGADIKTMSNLAFALLEKLKKDVEGKKLRGKNLEDWLYYFTSRR